MGETEFGVAIALAELKGEVNTGFATVKGMLDGALQRTDNAEREISDLKARVTALEKKILMVAGFTVAAGTSGGVSLWQLLGA
ncbi:hypothetical protein [Streptomyces sp. URMC 129]|uniref:hypothetical protein n=1 Tax=Streptomyces sp. URMC 129 TaxID=3423407 RepID=UPI003F1A26C7